MSTSPDTELPLVYASECDDNQPTGENVGGPFGTEQAARDRMNNNNTTGGLYVVYDDLLDSGYYIYCLESPIQSPGFIGGETL